MSFEINLLIFIIASSLIIVFGQPIDENCLAGHDSMEGCFQYISSNCKNATLTFDRLAEGDQCSNISLFWGSPLYNMTILFDSHYFRPYKLCIERSGCAKTFYTTDDGHELPVNWSSSGTEPACIETRRIDRPIMKLRFDAGDKWHCYGTFINFFYKL